MKTSADIEIVTFRPELRSDFEALNMVWLDSYSLLEPTDVDYLQNPEARILAEGGQIFFALQADGVIGTAAAVRVSESSIELAKLAVSPSAQGQGIGRRLSETVIEFARQHGATMVVLTSNSRLKQAIRLYESLGFQHAPMPQDIPYQTADVYMTLELKR
ncbi:MAG: GNAT family N-acetyltransferase [Blastocatellia bacterium]